MKKLLVLVTFTSILSSCSNYRIADEWVPIWKGYQISAIATPWQPVYFGGSWRDPAIRAHEWCHIRRMREIGSAKFMYKYFTDAEWACSEERLCQWEGLHPMCDGVE